MRLLLSVIMPLHLFMSHGFMRLRHAIGSMKEVLPCHFTLKLAGCQEQRLRLRMFHGCFCSGPQLFTHPIGSILDCY